MANWFYYDDNEQKQGPIDDRQLIILVTNRTILPETLIETEDGRQTKARKVKGLTFLPPPVLPDDTVSPDNPFVTPQPKSNTNTSSTEIPYITPPSIPVPPPEPEWTCPHCGNPMAAGERFCGSCGKSPNASNGKDDAENTGTGELLDIGFTRFITPDWISLAWVICIILTVISFLASLYLIGTMLPGSQHSVGSFAVGEAALVLAFFASIILHLSSLLFCRIVLELIIVVFKIEKNTRETAKNTWEIKFNS